MESISPSYLPKGISLLEKYSYDFYEYDHLVLSYGKQASRQNLQLFYIFLGDYNNDKIIEKYKKICEEEGPSIKINNLNGCKAKGSAGIKGIAFIKDNIFINIYSGTQSMFDTNFPEFKNDSIEDIILKVAESI